MAYGATWTGRQRPFFVCAEGTLDTLALKQSITPTLNDMNIECLGVDWSPQGRGGVLRVYIEVSDREVALEDCKRASREISALLDVEDPISSTYTLEVSSPGLDRPLFEVAHFSRFIGNEAKVTLKFPVQGRRRLRGNIIEVDGERICFDVDGKPFEVEANMIEHAHLIPDWDALGYQPAPKGGRGQNLGKTPRAKSAKIKQPGA